MPSDSFLICRKDSSGTNMSLKINHPNPVLPARTCTGHTCAPSRAEAAGRNLKPGPQVRESLGVCMPLWPSPGSPGRNFSLCFNLRALCQGAGLLLSLLDPPETQSWPMSVEIVDPCKGICSPHEGGFYPGTAGVWGWG